VQADVRLAPGNSGGPLADVQGRVIGINSMVAGGLGLAVPSNAVQRFLGAGGARPRLGVTMQPVVVPAGGGATLAGLLVLEVAAESAAEAAGLIVGDILIGTGMARFDGPQSLLQALDQAAASGGLQLDVLRGGRQIRVEAMLSVPRQEAA
jgi:serine protease Do